MSVVGDHKLVVVSSLPLQSADSGGSVLHTFADLGHRVVLQVGCVLLLPLDLIEAVLGLFVKQLGSICLISEETVSCLGDKHVALTLVSSWRSLTLLNTDFISF